MLIRIFACAVVVLLFLPGPSSAIDCIFLCGDRTGMSTLDQRGRQGFANAYLASRGENIYGLLGSAEIVNQSARMEETWAKWTSVSWPLTIYRQSAHVSDWTYTGTELTAASLAHDYLRLDKATGSGPLDVVGRDLSIQYFGGPKENLSFFGHWINLGTLFGGTDAIRGAAGVEIDMPTLWPASSRTTHDSWSNELGQTSTVAMVLATIGGGRVSKSKLPTVGIGLVGGDGGEVGKGFKQDVFAASYAKQGVVSTPKHYGDVNPQAGAAFYTEDWHLSDEPQRFGFYSQRGGNPPIGQSDIEISSPASDGIWPFIYRHGITGGVMGDGVVATVTAGGDIAGESVTVPPGGGIWLTGPNGTTRIEATNNSILFWVNNRCVAHVSLMGVMPGC